MARRIRRPLGPLDLRSQAILRAVIEEYVTTATPVGSQALVERYGLGVSSATVRNILAELEAAGLLTHPHTSRRPRPDRRRLPLLRRVDRRRRAAAGRRAADDPPPVRPGRVRQRALVPPRRHDPRRAHPSAGLATPAKPRAAHIRRIDLVAINERMASLILVLREGAIKQALVTLDERRRDRPADAQPRSPALLNERLVDVTAPARRGAPRRARRRRPRRARSPRRVGERIVRILREYDAAAVEEVFSDGLLNVMEAPEFAQSDKLRRVFTALENRAYLGELVGSVAGAGRVQVFIGAREPAARDARRLARPRARTAGRAGRSASSASSARPGCPTPRPSARSASCPAS